MIIKTNAVELTDTLYPEFIKEGLVLVDCTANWCNPCKQLSPIVDRLSLDLSDTLKVGKLDVDTNRDIVVSLGVRNIPALILFKDGEIVARNTGMISLEKLTDMVNEHK